MAHRGEDSIRAKDWWILDKTFKISNGTRSLVTRGNSSNEMRKIYLNAAVRHRSLYTPPVDTEQSDVRTKACETIPMGGGS